MKKILSKITVLICMIRLRATALHERIFIAAMLNPSLKSRFMDKFNRFSRILPGLVRYKISPLENKKRSKNKNVKKRVFIKIIKNVKNVFYIYVLKCLMLFRFMQLPDLASSFQILLTLKSSTAGSDSEIRRVNPTPSV